MICGMTAYTTWEREQMKNYLREIFSDILLSIVTKKYGTSLNDYQREEKAMNVGKCAVCSNSCCEANSICKWKYKEEAEKLLKGE